MSTQQHTEDRILTTHTGSLPRPPDLAALLEAAADGQQPEPTLFGKTAAAAVAASVRMQAEAGIDIISDGEQGAISFLDTRSRLTGFGGPMAPYFPLDLRGLEQAPSFASFFMRDGGRILASNDSRDIKWLPSAAEATISRFHAALAESAPTVTGFLTAPSPGVISRLGTSAFPTHEEFLFAIADAMSAEYRAIADAGLQVQLDSPDLLMGKHVDYIDSSIPEFRAVAEMHVEALNAAVSGIPASQLRLHTCPGNYPGPHHHDLPLEEIIDILYKARVGTLVLETANPRHRHEWQVFRSHPLPDGMMLAAGVVDVLSPVVEDPEVVAESLLQFASVVGKDRVLAGTGCGFATFAAVPEATLTTAALKLAALAEGASRASDRLWGRRHG